MTATRISTQRVQGSTQRTINFKGRICVYYRHGFQVGPRGSWSISNLAEGKTVFNGKFSARDVRRILA